MRTRLSERPSKARDAPKCKAKKLVLSARIERATCSLGGSRSIQLSYESNHLYNKAALQLVFKEGTDFFPSFVPSFPADRLRDSRRGIIFSRRRPGGGMADAADLKSASFGSTGSIPVPGTSLAPHRPLPGSPLFAAMTNSNGIHSRCR